jgi:hypothetical protein
MDFNGDLTRRRSFFIFSPQCESFIIREIHKSGIVPSSLQGYPNGRMGRKGRSVSRGGRVRSANEIANRVLTLSVSVAKLRSKTAQNTLGLWKNS